MKKLGTKRKYWRVSADRADLRRPELPVKTVTIPGEPQEVTIDLSHTAIIIVDMQNDFCSPQGWLDYMGVDYTPARRPIEPLNRLLPFLRKEKVSVIWLNWGNRPDLLNVSPSLKHVYNATGDGIGLGQPLPGNHSRVLEKGSRGAAIVDELHVEPDDIHVDKYRMSGFWDTPLDSILRNLDIDTLLFAGVNLDQCVMATLQDAVNLGYDSILLWDCSATTSPDFCTEATLYNIKQCFGFIIQSDLFLSELKV